MRLNVRVVLVHPAGSNWVEGYRDVSALANRMPPLGLLSLAAWLEKEGHQVRVIDCLGPKVRNGEDTISRILGEEPELVGFSTTTSAFLDAWQLTQGLKRIEPDLPVVFGGVHVSAIGGDLLRQFPEIDFLVIGEGEVTLGELAAKRNPADIAGLVFRDGEKIITNPVRQPITDLDSLPFPAYDKLAGFPDRYELPLFSSINAPGATMVTSRGCPYQCSYCDRSVFKRGYRYNSAAYIYEHMAWLRKRFGVRHLNIYDDLFTLHRERIEELCGKLIAKPLGLHFNCAVRVGHSDDQLLRLLKKAGCLMVSLGIESGDPRLLEVHKPGVYLEEVKTTVARIQAHGLRAKGLFMMGLPGESEESIKKTSDFVISLGLDDMNMAKFTPFFGAPVSRTIREQGELKEDWHLMNCLNFVFLPKDIASWQRLDELYNRHVKRFYSDPGWRRRLASRWWQYRHSFWRLIRHLPDFLAAMKSFASGRK
ncbi:MAG TPA: B12-binding domain-containing radical SAM protein [Desulfobulbaceae bacterium]|nr:B12-binding domain-containing radical SAM protein [Desulfobulbaceae bacterium]